MPTWYLVSLRRDARRVVRVLFVYRCGHAVPSTFATSDHCPSSCEYPNLWPVSGNLNDRFSTVSWGTGLTSVTSGKIKKKNREFVYTSCTKFWTRFLLYRYTKPADHAIIGLVCYFYTFFFHM